VWRIIATTRKIRCRAVCARKAEKNKRRLAERVSLVNARIANAPRKTEAVMKTPCGVFPFFSFRGCAEEAVKHYVSIFPDSKINAVEYFNDGERGVKGQVKMASFSLMGSPFMAFDIDVDCPPKNWAISFYANCADEAAFDKLLNALAAGGTVLMGPEAVFNLRKAAWVTDKYEVTWQIIWE
jgi:predicted 3-demethylubiquinone-9 3-methyltransferase (glyoxalase superfamily)